MTWGDDNLSAFYSAINLPTKSLSIYTDCKTGMLPDCFRLIEDVGLFNNAPNRNKKEVIAPYERKKNEEMPPENKPQV